jgi:hypothetical protein
MQDTLSPAVQMAVWANIAVLYEIVHKVRQSCILTHDEMLGGIAFVHWPVHNPHKEHKFVAWFIYLSYLLSVYLLGYACMCSRADLYICLSVFVICQVPEAMDAYGKALRLAAEVESDGTKTPTPITLTNTDSMSEETSSTAAAAADTIPEKPAIVDAANTLLWEWQDLPGTATVGPYIQVFHNKSDTEVLTRLYVCVLPIMVHT